MKSEEQKGSYDNDPCQKKEAMITTKNQSGFATGVNFHKRQIVVFKCKFPITNRVGMA